ncbi:hypothetical protein ACLVWU_08560 [Bdellovibrio sp. HCB290]|uniref:hypothetical protein n=1 Tax=Bdellovibrio sp. HCB290 TaxID=3394356 RepID=UPI0039B5417D
MIKRPRPFISACYASLSILIFAAIGTSMLWMYRGMHVTSREFQIIGSIFSVVSLIGLVSAFFPLVRLTDEYKYSKEKYRFYSGTFSVEEVEDKIRTLGYEKVADRLYIHSKFPERSSFRDKKHPAPHFLEIQKLGIDEKLLILKAWQVNKLAAADWRLTMHDSFEELEKKILFNLKRITYSEAQMVIKTFSK